jgi:poly(3-hydroxyoctanoate) depolymerase
VWARGHPVRVNVVGSGEPLLLVNGLTRPLSSWDPFVAALENRTIVSFDAPGVGASRAPLLPLSIGHLADLSVSVLDELGLDCVDVLGFSHGGAVVQQLAFSYPERVRRLVLVATTCGIGSTLPPWNSHEGLAILMNGTLKTNPLSTVWRTMAISSWSSIPFLGSIAAPTLVVCGDQDRVTPIANSRVLAGRIPDAVLVELAEGHDLQLPAPAQKLARVVEEFFVREPTRDNECSIL